MCVIIDKHPGHELPFETLLSAATRNPDGWGVVLQDSAGNQELRRGLSKPGFAADAVARALEEIGKDGRALIHFRYRTQGDKTLDNVHPFKVLDPKEDELGIYLMHNGTLADFGHHTRADSDSKEFVDCLVRPMALLVANMKGPEEVLEDPIFKTVLEKYAGGVNKFSLIDGKGKVLHINEKHGNKFPWGWASNSYSLSSIISDQDWRDSGRENPRKKTSVPVTLPTAANSNGSSFLPLTARPQGSADTTKILSAATATNKQDLIADYEPRHRVDLRTVLGIGDLSELFCLDENQYRTIVTKQPDCAVLMLIELTYALYEATKDQN